MKLIQNILESGGITHDPEWKKQFQSFILISLIFHLLTAYFSYGFGRPDEHFQILEFLNYKLKGYNNSGLLAHEYAEELRSWLQPALYYAIVKSLIFSGTENPFIWAFFIRLISSLIGWLSLILFGLCFYTWFPNARLRSWALFLLTYLWWIPYLHARTSSENLSTSFFYLALASIALACTFQKKEPGNNSLEIPTQVLIVSGLLCGLAFEFRYQVGFMVAGIGLWLLFIKRISLLRFSVFGVSVLIPIIFEFLIDGWGYGKLSFPPWNYFSYNLFEGKSADYGESPWWHYFYSISLDAFPPLSIILVLTTLIAWVRYPKHILTWSTIFFFIVHCMVGHKEDRFLYPMTYAAVAFAFLSIPESWMEKGIVDRFLKKKGGRLFINVTIGLNMALLVIMTFIPTRTEVMIQKYLYYHNPELIEIYSIKGNPYIFRGDGDNFEFYSPKKVIFHKVSNLDSLKKILDRESAPILYLHHSNLLDKESMFLEENCQTLHRSFPEWVNRVNINNWLSRTPAFLLLKCG
ncbi:MAG TPA: hypothetical protein QF468_09140 [Nitrospinota bacterium]|jgi:phosphatidylinositol glycan class B|nr:hypothetical protein [Nitrospinota bacterium]